MSNEEEQIEQIEKQKEELSKQIIPLDIHDKSIEALRKQLRSLESAREDIKAKNWKVRQEVNALDRQEEVLKSQLELRREKERQAEELLARMAGLDILTQGAKWRVGVEDGQGEVRRIKDYQDYGAKFMATAKRVINADEMGLGKTLQSIASVDMMQAKKILIITPAEVMSGFLSEMKFWANRPAIILGRKSKAQIYSTIKMINDIDAEEIVVIINYESWARDKKLLTMLSSMQFDTIIADEAHRIKEMDTSAYQGVETLVEAENTCGRCKGVVLKNMCTKGCAGWNGVLRSVENLIFLTGTPLLNRPTEIFPLLHLIAPKIFPNLRRFVNMFCENVSDDPRRPEYVFREGGFDMLANKIQGMYIRRTLKDTGIELPPQEVRIHEIDLDPDDYPLQTQLMEMLREHAQIMIDDNPAMDFMSQLALLTRMRQAAVWPGGIKLKQQERYPDGSLVWFQDPDTGETKPVMQEMTVGDHFRESVKLDRCMEMLKEYVSEGKRVVIFTQFAEVIREILGRCEHEGIRAVGYFGDTKPMDRDIIKRNFDRKMGEESKWDVVVAHYKTGGVGVNFTACERMILTDEEWNPGMEDQAMKRIHRIGQTEHTIVDILRLNDHIDTWLAQLIANKRSMINNFNDKTAVYQELMNLLTRAPEKKD